MLEAVGLRDLKSEVAELGRSSTKPQSLIAACRKKGKIWLLAHICSKDLACAWGFPLTEALRSLSPPQAPGMRFYPRTKPSLQAEGWKHADVPVRAGDSVRYKGAHRAAWAAESSLQKYLSCSKALSGDVITKQSSAE